MGMPPKEKSHSTFSKIVRAAQCMAVTIIVIGLGTWLGMGRSIVPASKSGEQFFEQASGSNLDNTVQWEDPILDPESRSMIFRSRNESGFSGQIRLFAENPDSGNSAEAIYDGLLREGWQPFRENMDTSAPDTPRMLYRDGEIRVVLTNPLPGTDSRAAVVFEGVLGSSRGK